MPDETVNHPEHYGGDVIYEAIKVIEAHNLGFHEGNAVKYILRAGKKHDHKEDIRKAIWYLQRAISDERVADVTGPPAPNYTPQDAMGCIFCGKYNEHTRDECEV